MSEWRYLLSEAVPAAAGLAFDEAMMLGYGRGAVSRWAGTLRLYTYRPHCALVGRYQNVEDEIDLAYCERHDVQIGRRPTGGGTIIMGPDQLGVAIAVRRDPTRAPRQVLMHYAEGVIAALAELGVEARFRSKNDLEVAGKKIAGLGLYADAEGALLFHASVLVDLDVDLMLRVLEIPGAKLSDKSVSRVEDRVTTVARLRGGKPRPDELRETFGRGLSRAFGVELVPGRLDANEEARRVKLTEQKYDTREWTFQRGPRDSAEGRATLKTPAGLLRLHIGVQGSSIKSLLVAGDFNVLPDGLTRLESALRWSRADRPSIEARVREHLSHSDLQVAPEMVAAAIWTASRRALRRQQSAHPARSRGSCYLPAADATRSPEAREEHV